MGCALGHRDLLTSTPMGSRNQAADTLRKTNVLNIIADPKLMTQPEKHEGVSLDLIPQVGRLVCMWGEAFLPNGKRTLGVSTFVGVWWQWQDRFSMQHLTLG